MIQGIENNKNFQNLPGSKELKSISTQSHSGYVCTKWNVRKNTTGDKKKYIFFHNKEWFIILYKKRIYLCYLSMDQNWNSITDFSTKFDISNQWGIDELNINSGFLPQTLNKDKFQMI